MSVTTMAGAAADAAPLPPPSTFWKRFSRNPVAMVSLAILIAITLVAVFAPEIAPPVRSGELPAWYPQWAQRLAELYFSGTTCLFVVHGNVPNNGCIENLPQDGCVEVACLVNRNGIQPTHFGRLPRQMAAICDSNMRMFDLAVEAVLHRSKEMAAQALMLDPLTSAVCCPAEIWEMTMRLFDAEAAYLPDYK